MKITKAEAAAMREGLQHAAAIRRLSAQLARAPVPRLVFCSVVAAEVLQACGFSEDKAREHVFRLLSLIEATQQGEALVVQEDEAPDDIPATVLDGLKPIDPSKGRN